MAEENKPIFRSLTELKPIPEQNIDVVEVQEQKKGPGRPKSKPKEPGPQVRNRSPLNSDMTYLETYMVPAGMINKAITELDDLAARINADINEVRSSRTLKSKYLYIANLTGALTGTISSKVSAIRELRGMINDANNLELKKQAQLKINERDSDDKILMDMYNAYINAPVGSMSPVAAQQMNMPPQYINNTMHNTVDVVNMNGTPVIQNVDAGYENYLRNLTPEQNAMIQGTNPNIETVVVYDQSSHNRWFENINVLTGEPVPNLPVPNEFVLNGTNIDIRHGTARNASLNQTYKLKVVGIAAADEF